jgi:hypothetical protein
MDNSSNKLSSSSIVTNQSFSKLSNLTVFSLIIQAILLPLVVTVNSAVVKAEELKPKQLIAQSCRRNSVIRASNGRNTDVPRGNSGSACDYKLDFQSDGNLVLMNKSGQVLWATGTEGRGEILSMQSDGNLVIYGGGKALWATNTGGNHGAFFAIQSDGNLVVYRSDGRQSLWASNTDGGQVRTNCAACQWSGGGSQIPTPTSQLHNNPTTSNPLKGFRNPLPNIYPISQSPNGGYSHPGSYAIDFATPDIGTRVFAMRAGKVIKVVDDYPDTGGGYENRNRVNYVAIQHENGYISLYLHLQQGFSRQTGVVVGNTVNAGDLIGYSGNSGWSSGQHLHVEVDKDRVFNSVPFEIDGIFRF